MIRSFRLLGFTAVLASALAAVAVRAEAVSSANSTPARPAERSADEAMYDARYGMLPRNDTGQGAMERSGATGGGGQHG